MTAPRFPARLVDLPIEHASSELVVKDASALFTANRDAALPRSTGDIRSVVLCQTGLPPHGGMFALRQLEDWWQRQGEPFGWHFVVPQYQEPEETGSASPTVIRCVPDDLARDVMGAFQVMVAFEGFFESPSNFPAQAHGTLEQVAAIRPLLRYLLRRYDLSELDVYTPTDFGAAEPPGTWLEMRLGVYRREALTARLDSWHDRQLALARLGLLSKEAVTGDYNAETRRAVLRLEPSEELPPTGLWSRPVDTKVRRLLKEKTR